VDESSTSIKLKTFGSADACRHSTLWLKGREAGSPQFLRSKNGF